MTHPNWDRIQEIYHAALATPRSERDAFVANTCAGDPDLEREIKSLLKAADSSGGVLDTPVMTLGSVPANLVGTVIGERYLVERELRPGGMSQVYLARDLRLQCQAVVIKIISRALVADSYARQKFKQEVEALLRIDHPGVVRVLDKDELPDGWPYIVMEYVDGETLRSQISNEGMNLERAASILKQIGTALEHVHEKGIFHRDLKPANIMLKRDTDSVVLVDFGIAKVKESVIAPSTVNGAAFGTPGYVSPEQLRGEEITAASDIYSMAVIAYEMVTGRLPFNSTPSAKLLDTQRHDMEIKPVAPLSPKAQDLILRGLSPKPLARYQNAKRFGDDLAHALLDSPVPPEQKQWLRVIGASLTILVGVALLSFGIYWFINRRPDKVPTRSFSYWLTIQRTRDGKDYQDPRKSNGEETFDRGDKFQLAVSSPEPGYLYIINEGPLEPNDTSFTMIYPNLATSNGSATLGANQSFQSDWITFRGPEGDENFWIVWSVSPVTELESAKAEAFKHPEGGLTGQNLVAVKEFLRMKQLEVKVTVTHYKASQTAKVRGTGDILVTLAQFKHR